MGMKFGSSAVWPSRLFLKMLFISPALAFQLLSRDQRSPKAGLC